MNLARQSRPGASDIAARLDKLRADTPGLRLAAYGDLGARLILRSSSDTGWPQDRLDELCLQAEAHFARSGAGALATLAGDDGWTPVQAIALTPGEARVFLRGNGEDTALLCCICDVGPDIDATVAAAGRVLRDILDAG
jgi:hypothetical protein